MRHRITTKPSAIARKAQMRVFACDVCGVKTIAPKMVKKTSVGHKKDYYCFKCQALTKHTQIE